MRAFFVGMWQAILVRGIASIVFGILALVYPGATVGVLVTIFGIYALLDGVTALWSVSRGKRGNRAFTAGGALSMVPGATILFYPVAGAISVFWIIAANAVMVGAVMVCFTAQVAGGRPCRAPTC